MVGPPGWTPIWGALRRRAIALPYLSCDDGDDDDDPPPCVGGNGDSDARRPERGRGAVRSQDAAMCASLGVG
eukprot:914270-Pyramimonas_sp.AAC.1